MMNFMLLAKKLKMEVLKDYSSGNFSIADLEKVENILNGKNKILINRGC